MYIISDLPLENHTHESDRPERGLPTWGRARVRIFLISSPSMKLTDLRWPIDMYAQRVTSFVPGARDLQIVDSTLSVVGGDVHNHYYNTEHSRDIWAILRSIPNFRKIYQDMLSKATEGTGMWLVKGDRFRVWLEPNGDIKIFWGLGIRKSRRHALADSLLTP